MLSAELARLVRAQGLGEFNSLLWRIAEIDFMGCFRITVSGGGSFSATVPARSAIAIHTGATGTGSGSGSGGGGTGSGSVAVTFQETATTTFGEVCP